MKFDHIFIWFIGTQLGKRKDTLGHVATLY
jgi:hypothetical protein